MLFEVTIMEDMANCLSISVLSSYVATECCTAKDNPVLALPRYALK